MTTSGFLAAAARQWPVVLLGLVLTAWACVSALAQPGLWSIRHTVVLLPPVADFRPNVLEDSDTALTMIASLIVLDVNGGPARERFASPEASLFGVGLTEATRVRVRDTGGQWAPSISRPYIDVEAVSYDRAAAEAEVARIEQRLAEALDRLQRDRGVSPAMRVSLSLSPDEAGVAQVPISRTRALGATGLVGALATAAAVLGVDRLRGRGRR